jgi:hypothetical protein
LIPDRPAADSSPASPRQRAKTTAEVLHTFGTIFACAIREQTKRWLIEKETVVFWRRRFPRLRKDFQIAYRVVDQEKFHNDPISSLALNISGGGVGFEATENIPNGALVALEIRADDFSTPILALAKVVWCKPRGAVYEVGAEFWWIGWGDTLAQTTIANYVASQTNPAIMSLLE